MITTEEHERQNACVGVHNGGAVGRCFSYHKCAIKAHSPKFNNQTSSITETVANENASPPHRSRYHTVCVCVSLYVCHPATPFMLILLDATPFFSLLLLLLLLLFSFFPSLTEAKQRKKQQQKNIKKQRATSEQYRRNNNKNLDRTNLKSRKTNTPALFPHFLLSLEPDINTTEHTKQVVPLTTDLCETSSVIKRSTGPCRVTYSGERHKRPALTGQLKRDEYEETREEVNTQTSEEPPPQTTTTTTTTTTHNNNKNDTADRATYYTAIIITTTTSTLVIRNPVSLHRVSLRCNSIRVHTHTSATNPPTLNLSLVEKSNQRRKKVEEKVGKVEKFGRVVRYTGVALVSMKRRIPTRSQPTGGAGANALALQGSSGVPPYAAKTDKTDKLSSCPTINTAGVMDTNGLLRPRSGGGCARRGVPTYQRPHTSGGYGSRRAVPTTSSAGRGEKLGDAPLTPTHHHVPTPVIAAPAPVPTPPPAAAPPVPAPRRATPSSSPAPSSAMQYLLVVVLDLDETLIFSRGNRVFERQGVGKLLQTLKGRCEVIVWTAGTRDYALDVIRIIDPYFSIQHCIYRHPMWWNGEIGCTKDLRMLGRPMDRVLLIDNTPEVFRANPDHGILVSDFLGRESLGGRADRTLGVLADIFEYVLSHLTDPKTSDVFASHRLSRRTFRLDGKKRVEIYTVIGDRHEEGGSILRSLCSATAAASLLPPPWTPALQGPSAAHYLVGRRVQGPGGAGLVAHSFSASLLPRSISNYIRLIYVFLELLVPSLVHSAVALYGDPPADVPTLPSRLRAHTETYLRPAHNRGERVVPGFVHSPFGSLFPPPFPPFLAQRGEEELHKTTTTTVTVYRGSVPRHLTGQSGAIGKQAPRDGRMDIHTLSICRTDGPPYSTAGAKALFPRISKTATDSPRRHCTSKDNTLRTLTDVWVALDVSWEKKKSGAATNYNNSPPPPSLLPPRRAQRQVYAVPLRSPPFPLPRGVFPSRGAGSTTIGSDRTPNETSFCFFFFPFLLRIFDLHPSYIVVFFFSLFLLARVFYTGPPPSLLFAYIYIFLLVRNFSFLIFINDFCCCCCVFLFIIQFVGETREQRTPACRNLRGLNRSAPLFFYVPNTHIQTHPNPQVPHRLFVFFTPEASLGEIQRRTTTTKKDRPALAATRFWLAQFGSLPLGKEQQQQQQQQQKKQQKIKEKTRLSLLCDCRSNQRWVERAATKENAILALYGSDLFFSSRSYLCFLLNFSTGDLPVNCWRTVGRNNNVFIDNSNISSSTRVCIDVLYLRSVVVNCYLTNQIASVLNLDVFTFCLSRLFHATRRNPSRLLLGKEIRSTKEFKLGQPQAVRSLSISISLFIFLYFVVVGAFPFPFSFLRIVFTILSTILNSSLELPFSQLYPLLPPPLQLYRYLLPPPGTKYFATQQTQVPTFSSSFTTLIIIIIVIVIIGTCTNQNPSSISPGHTETLIYQYTIYSSSKEKNKVKQPATEREKSLDLLRTPFFCSFLFYIKNILLPYPPPPSPVQMMTTSTSAVLHQSVSMEWLIPSEEGRPAALGSGTTTRNPTPPPTALGGRRPVSIHLNRLSSRAGPADKRSFSPSQRPPSSPQVSGSLRRPNTGHAAQFHPINPAHLQQPHCSPAAPGASCRLANTTPGTSTTNINIGNHRSTSANKPSTPSLMTFSLDECIPNPPYAFTSRPLTRQGSLTEAFRASVVAAPAALRCQAATVAATPCAQLHTGPPQLTGLNSTSTLHLGRQGSPSTRAVRFYEDDDEGAMSDLRGLCAENTSLTETVTLDCDAVLFLSSPSGHEEEEDEQNDHPEVRSALEDSHPNVHEPRPRTQQQHQLARAGQRPHHRGVSAGRPFHSAATAAAIAAEGEREEKEDEDEALCLSEWPSMMSPCQAMEWLAGSADTWESIQNRHTPLVKDERGRGEG
eukprot:gene2321-1457_t